MLLTLLPWLVPQFQLNDPPPPMANQLPWLVPLFQLNDPRQEPEFHSPSDRKSYRLPIPRSLRDSCCLASYRGWLLLLDDINYGRTPTSKQPFLFNPITANQIPLPPISLIPRHHAIGAMSTTPMDPNCVILLVVDCCAFLYRLNDHCAADWTIIRLRLTTIERAFGGSVIYCGHKFYCLYNSADKLYAIDPFLQKAASPLVMRYSCGASTDACRTSLHEIGGELFKVQMLIDPGKRFRVFKADLSRQEWVTVVTLGEHVLFHDKSCSVILSATDVGCKRNSIYARKTVRWDVKLGHKVCEWGSFDLGTDEWTEEDILTHGLFGPWLLPTLDSADPTRASN